MTLMKRFGLALAGLVALIVLLPVAQEARETRRAQAKRDAFYADPIVKELDKKGNEQCIGDKYAYLWACGTLLKLKKTHFKLCSTEKEPRFVGRFKPGNIGSSSCPGPGPSWRYSTEYSVPGYVGAEYQLTVYGGHTLDWLPDNIQEYPESLPLEPDWSAADKIEKRTFAQLDGRFVAFWTTNLENGRPSPGDCGLLTIHPDYPVAIMPSFNCDQLHNWKSILRDAFTQVSNGVIHYETNANCGNPPKSARFYFTARREVNVHLDEVPCIVTPLRDWKGME